MRFVKPRKPRGIKMNGYPSEDMCSGCLSFGCDPMSDSPAWSHKKDKRREAGVCRSCGQMSCICKSKLKIEVPIIKTHDNRKSKGKGLL